MADVFETRSVSEDFHGSANLIRVACIGDSMMYGQGVVARETLPAHLDRLLNAAWLDDLVWVDNFGETSGNLWHAWARMKRRAQSKHFDAIVFSVCQNDSQPFESNTVPYDSDKLSYWRPGSIYFRLVRDLLTDFAEFCDAGNIIPAVVFYSYLEEDRPIVEILQELTMQIGLPFLDLLGFLQQQTAINNESYWASEFDGHPSGLAHDLAARAIATGLSKPARERWPGRFGADPARVLWDAVNDLIDQRVPVDAALEWAAQALAAKERAARRRLRDGSAAVAAACARSALLIKRLQEAWHFARRIEAAIESAALPRDYFEFLVQMFATTWNADEAVFLMDKCRDAAETRQLGSLYPPGGYYDQEGRLDFFTGDVKREIALARSQVAAVTIAGFDPTGAAADAPGGCRPLLRDSLDVTTGRPELAGAFAGIARIHEYLASLERAASRLGATVEDGGARRFWAITFNLVNAFIYYLKCLDRLIADRLPAQPPAANTWTCVDVVVEGGPDPAIAGDVCLLQVEADYRVPRRTRRRDQRWAGVAKDRAAYHFEIPLMLLGDVRVGVSADEPTRERFLRGTTRIARIEIYNAPGGPIARRGAGGRPTIGWSDPDSRLPVVELANILPP